MDVLKQILHVSNLEVALSGAIEYFKFKENVFDCAGLVVWVYCILTFVGYLMPNSFLYK